MSPLCLLGYGLYSRRRMCLGKTYLPQNKQTKNGSVDGVPVREHQEARRIFSLTDKNKLTLGVP